jgi:hypothetical protein
MALLMRIWDRWPRTKRTTGSNANIRLKLSGFNIHRVVLTPLEGQTQCNSDVFFLSETHVHKAKAEKLMMRLGFHHFLIFEK